MKHRHQKKPDVVKVIVLITVILDLIDKITSLLDKLLK